MTKHTINLSELNNFANLESNKMIFKDLYKDMRDDNGNYWQYNFEEFQKDMQKNSLKDAESVIPYSFISSVNGGELNVPNYLNGLPNCFIQSDLSEIPNEFRTINCYLGVPSSIKSSHIVNQLSKLQKLIDLNSGTFLEFNLYTGKRELKGFNEPNSYGSHLIKLEVFKSDNRVTNYSSNLIASSFIYRYYAVYVLLHFLANKFNEPNTKDCHAYNSLPMDFKDAKKYLPNDTINVLSL